MKKTFTVFFLLVGILKVYAQPLNVNFSTKNLSGCAPLMVVFKNQSTGNIASYFWDFGNSNTSILADPSTIYKNEGYYDIKLVVTDIYGNKDSIIKSKYIHVLKAPKANLYASKLLVCAHDSVSFFDSSTEGEAKIISWTWGLDSGATSTLKNPAFSYYKGNDYSIALSVKDANGCISTIFRPQYVRVIDAPIPDFEFKPVSLCSLPVTVDFINKTKNNSGQPLNYLWYFGILDTSSNKNPSYKFSKNGIHDIILQVSHGDICTRIISKKEFIDLNVPKTDFIFLDSLFCNPALVRMNSTTKNISNAGFLWDLGNGYFSKDSNASTTYYKPGNYKIKLTVKNGNGCSNTKEKIVNIGDARDLLFDFGSVDSLTCKNGKETQFTYTSNRKIASQYWEFGDSTTSNLASPNHFLHKGVYDVRLTLIDEFGCQGTKTKYAYMKVNPIIPKFEVTKAKGCINLETKFINTSSSYFPLVSQYWDFGNRDTSTQKSPTEIYKKLGRYEPSLIVKNSIGCTDKYTYYSIYVSEKPKADFTFKRGNTCADNDEISFKNLTNNGTIKANFFYWDFGRNNIDYDSRDVHPIVNFSTPGTYTITLVAENYGCMDTMIKKDTLNIFRSKARISFYENPCIDDSVQFTAFVPKRSRIEWYIDGIYFGKNLKFTSWLAYGIHNIKLVSYDSTFDCTDEMYRSVEIRKPYQTDFTEHYESKILCSFIPATFKDVGLNHVNSAWYIHDGVDSIFVENPKKYVFKSSGVKTVRLVSQNDLGCVTEKTKSFTAYEPISSVSTNINSICFPDTIKLMNQTTGTADIRLKYWVIDKDTVRFPADTLNYYFDKYPQNGNKGINLYFYSYDENQCVSIDTAFIKISKISGKISDVTNYKLCDSSTSYINHDFKNSYPINGNNLRWFINNEEQENKLNTFRFIAKKDTNFTVKLIVNDLNLACVDTSETINVSLIVKKLNASFFASDTIGNCPPLTVNYTNTSTAINTKISSYSWDFNDTFSSIFPNPSKTYFYPGKFGAILTIKDEEGCEAKASLPNLVTLKGPKVNFFSNVKEGCIPTTVNFNVHMENVDFFLWDLGNGIVSADENPTTIYNYAEVFNPFILAQDSLGCTVYYFDDTTILIHENPKVNFYTEGLCKNAPFISTNLSTNMNHPKTTYKWFFENGDSSVLNPVSHSYNTSGYKEVSLQATSEFRCKHDTSISFFVSPISANFEMSKDTICYGEKVKLTDQSNSEHKIIKWDYQFGNGESASEKNIEYEYTKFGNYNISLKITDEKGCFDTITKLNKILVFDSVSPKQINMKRVTVNSENEVQFDWEKDNAASTLYYKLYKWENGIFDKTPSYIDKTETQYFESGLNTSQNNYAYYITNKSFCHQNDILDTIQKHQTILLKTHDGENKIRLNWSPYLGWKEIEKYQIFRKESHQNNFELIAEISGTSTTFLDEKVICDYHYEYRIIAEENKGNSQTSFSNFDDANSVISSVPFPPLVIRATVNSDNETQIDWDFSQANMNPIKTYYLQKSLDGNNYQNIAEINDSVCCKSLYDYNVNTDNSSYYYQLIAKDICGISSVPSNIGKTILLDVNKNREDNPTLNWSEYLEWENGIEKYEIELKDENFLFKKIKEKYENEILFYTDSDSEYDAYEALCYRIKAISTNKINGEKAVSYSNEKCVIGRSNLFIPNAFTPNSDSHNPEFIVYGRFIKTFNMKIYNRWGQMIFESNDINKSWKGDYNETPVPDGVYLYIVNAEGYDEHQINLSGSITLLR